MTPSIPCPRRPGAALAGALLAPVAWLALSGTPAQAAEPASRVTRVTVYPGVALVERSARVVQGARQLVLPCLPANFDVQQLRLEADTGIRIGPVSAVTLPREQVPACNASVQDERIRALEDQIAALGAESAGHDLALAYLKTLAPDATDTAASAAPQRSHAAPTQIQATAETIRRLGQDALTQQQRLARQREVLEQQLQPLLQERERLRSTRAQVRSVSVSLSASRDGEVRLRYEISGPSWSPAYRATLESASRSVTLERLALVSQASGEDWQGVQLRLSTGSPRSAVTAPLPRPWQLAIAPPRPPAAPVALAMSAAPSPRMLAKSSQEAESDAAPEPDFTVQTVQGEFSTEFEVPGAVDLASGRERVSFALGTQSVDARLLVRVSPAVQPTAYLVAELARPEGVWPDGPLQLWRGAQLVGASIWRSGGDGSPASRERLSLPFGRDELVRVQVNPNQQRNASAGFIGSRTERREQHVYLIENRHPAPVDLQVLEASPVSTDERISVTRQFNPAPTLDPWQDQPGLIAWEQRLAPAATARFQADYVITLPKDSPLSESR
jgi:uncharacterized protein (TIGR02231 family)